ncbi:unnamed protein product, partial [Mesorhabditis spiculigera]
MKRWALFRALIFVSSFVIVAGVLLILLGSRYSAFVSEDHMSTGEAHALLILGAVLTVLGIVGWVVGVWREVQHSGPDEEEDIKTISETV